MILALLLAASLALVDVPQDRAADPVRLESAQLAFDAGFWQQAADLATGPAEQSSELDLIRGLALAHLERWDDARAAFESGRRKSPRDSRFSAELAGVAYKQKKLGLAKRELRAAIRQNPADAYNREFLGTIYFIEGNLEAALQHWNPIDKPRLNSVSFEPAPTLNEKLLRPAVAFNPPQVLTIDSLLATTARLEDLEVFSRPRLDLSPSPTNTYDATIHAVEKNGFGDSWLGGLLSTFGGVFYSTAYPQYFNAGHQAINFASLARWDAQKRRFSATLSTPLAHNPTLHLELFADARNENWNLSQTFTGSLTPVSNLNVRSVSGGVKLKFIPSGHWSWNTGVEIGSHAFRNTAATASPAAAHFFTDTNSLAVWLGAERSLLRFPEHRFTIDATTEARTGRNFASALGGFGILRGALLARWFPQARGDDYEVHASLRAGGLAGRATLDELFQLGIERDNDLWLRGHTGTSAGRKGAAPVGRRYFLANFELDKTLYNAGFLKVKLGPLLDIGSIADSSAFFGSGQWLVDAGAQCKVQLIGGVTLVVSYGHDFRSGHNLVFPTVLH